MERSGLAAIWRGTCDLWLEPNKVEAARPSRPIARIPASRVFGSDAHAVLSDFTLRKPPVILGCEGIAFVTSLPSVSKLMTDRDISAASRRAVDRTVIKSVHAPLASDEETL